MDNITLRKIALLAGAVVTASVYFNDWLISSLLFNENSTTVNIIVSLATGLIAYWFTEKAVNYFLLKRLKQIYQMIYRQNHKSIDAVKIDLDKPLFKEVENEVSLFIKAQKNEMNTLRHLENYRKDFVGNVAHELKTPIFNIQGYVHTLIDGAIDDPEVNKSYLQKAADNIDRLIKIIEDLDSIYKLESNQLKLEWQSIDLGQFIDSMMDEIKLLALEKSVTVRYEPEVESDIDIIADPDYLRQVFINLLENSIKYGREQRGETLIKVLELDTQVLVEINDNGPGIEARHLRHLFDRFYRVDKARSRQAGGSGLGLSIVKHIIEAMGQSIQVRSTIGSGSTFSFTLDKASPKRLLQMQNDLASGPN